ncbi:hypothetical protein H4W31_003981 [Plantactinospora soyae]|uniref:Uncharacterized protein n=1 Tax=Plantactinospora soyae TaxID=1544732 RepID=A0A927M551_9ACTN|nr:hypothetical protein [Plantactinospora soyae]
MRGAEDRNAGEARYRISGTEPPRPVPEGYPARYASMIVCSMPLPALPWAATRSETA